MIMTFEFGLDTVKMNHHGRYLGQRSLSSKVIVRTHRQTDRHTHTGEIALRGPLKC